MPLLLYCEFLTQWSTSFTATDFEGRERERGGGGKNLSSQRSQLSKTRSILLLQLYCYPACKMAPRLLSNAASLKATTFKERREKTSTMFLNKPQKEILGFCFLFRPILNSFQERLHQWKQRFGFFIHLGSNGQRYSWMHSFH